MSQTDRTFGAVTVLTGEKNGKYPHGNSLLVRGRDSTAIVDPSLSVVARAGELRDRADLVVLSHVHEDHVAGVHLFPAAAVHAHREDAPGLRSLDGFLAIYGAGMATEAMRDYLVSGFHYVERPDTHGFDDGAMFELGGSRIRVIHAPGHTRGHCALLVEPEGVLFLGDIDLSSFGPYYGDAWSDLGDFEQTLAWIGDVEARVWVSFHHVGVITEREEFRARLARFAARIGERERALLVHLAEPRTLEEMVAHRFLYPPGADLAWVDAAERRTIGQHLDRLLAQGRVECTGEGTFRANDAG